MASFSARVGASSLALLVLLFCVTAARAEVGLAPHAARRLLQPFSQFIGREDCNQEG
jgi:hypothetical protein